MVAFVGRAVGARLVTWFCKCSTSCRKISIAFPVVALASAAVRPLSVAIGILISPDSNVYPGKSCTGEIFMVVGCSSILV